MANAEKVKVKILKFVGSHQPGEVIEVTPEVAASLCKVSNQSLGEGKIDQHRKAILLSEAEAMESQEVDVRKMSSKELADMGRRNVVPTPKDPLFEARMAQMNAGKKVQAPRTLSDEAIEDDTTQPEWVPGAEDEKAAEAQAEGESEAGAEVESSESAPSEAGAQEAAATGKKKASGSKKASAKK